MADAPLDLNLSAVSTITLNRPDKQNAMTAEMGQALAHAVEKINASAEPRVVLLRGAGRAFSAGGDFDLLEANTQADPEENRRRMRDFYGIFLSITELRVPSVAVLHGAAVGAGLCLAMACDLRLAANEAKLGVNFVRVGLHPGMGCTALLPRLVGAATATDLMLTGRLIRGDEAARIGLVNDAVPRDALDERVDERAGQIAAGAPVAVAQTKATLSRSLRQELLDALDHEAAMQAVSFATADIREAIAAFRASRPPSFAGR